MEIGRADMPSNYLPFRWVGGGVVVLGGPIRVIGANLDREVFSL